MVSLDTFLGDWRDTLGNDVRATLEGPSGIQVVLKRPNGREVLTIKRLPDGRSFECGHFLLDRKTNHQGSDRLARQAISRPDDCVEEEAK